MPPIETNLARQIRIPVQAETIASAPELKISSTGDQVKAIQSALTRYGYLGLDEGEFNPGLFEDSTRKALEKFQNAYGLPETGTLSEKTRDLLASPRCGVPDPSPLAFSAVDRWSSRSLRYCIGDVSGIAVSPNQAREAIRRAFKTWKDQGSVGFSFEEVGKPKDAHIHLFWTTPASDPRLSGKSTFAMADFPPGPHSPTQSALPKEVHFDRAEHSWHDGSELDVETVCLHEIGHILGLGHEPGRQTSIMYPHYRGTRRNLATDDINGLKALYL